MGIIKTIREEIERRMNELAKDKSIDLHDTLCRTKELNLLLSFLDTLQEPEVDLEEEVKQYWNNHSLEYRLGRIADIDFLHLCARHFYNLGKNAK